MTTVDKWIYVKVIVLFMKYIIQVCIFSSGIFYSVMSNSQNTQPGTSFDLQGHRGCRGLMPENTIAAMYKAIDLGVTTLELDVVISKDNEVIVSHDPWFHQDITTLPDGSSIPPGDETKYMIYKMTYEEIKTFDVGMKLNPRFPQQQKIKAIKPRLGDLIDSVEKYAGNLGKKMFYNIETKSSLLTDNLMHPAPSHFVDTLMVVIHSKNINERVIIQSFDYRTLQYLHQKFPQVKTAALVNEENTRKFERQLKELGFYPTIYSPHYSHVNAELIDDCHKRGIKIIPWAVNDPKRMLELRKMGVDGLITDYPNYFKL